MKVKDLTPANYNPRKITDIALSKLDNSLKKFGDLSGVVFNRKTGTLIGAHQRLKNISPASEIFKEKVENDPNNTVAIGYILTPSGQRFAYREVEWDKIEEKAANLAANNHTIHGGWDIPLLEPNLEELKFELDDFDDLGFNDLATNLDIDLNNIEADGNTDTDHIPEIEKKPVIKVGNLIELGKHRVFCGDSTKKENIEKLFNGKTWDCLIFDPPYELEELYKTIPKYQKGQKIVIFWDFKRFGIAPAEAIRKGWTPQYEFIWDNITSWYTPNRPLARHKACGIFAADPFFDTSKAIINDGKERKAKIVSNTRGQCDYKPLDGAKHISTVEQFQNTQVEGEHGHAKPMDWIQAIYNGLDCEVFFDMFGGSGSTLIYAEKNQKKSFTMELDPKYCQVIIQRWVDFTEKFEVKINGKIVDWRELRDE